MEPRTKVERLGLELHSGTLVAMKRETMEESCTNKADVSSKARDKSLKRRVRENRSFCIHLITREVLCRGRNTIRMMMRMRT